MWNRILIWGQPARFRNYAAAVKYVGGRMLFSTEVSAAEECGGLLLPGGGDVEPWRYGEKNTASYNLEPERDAVEWQWLEHCCRLQKPVLGICRGMQSVNVFFGGTLCQDVPGHGQICGADRLHRVDTAPSVFRELYGERYAVNSAHHQAVERLGSGLLAVQWAADGVVEGICHGQLPVWGVQWHPERLTALENGRALFAWFVGLCERNESR